MLAWGFGVGGGVLVCAIGEQCDTWMNGAVMGLKS